MKEVLLRDGSLDHFEMKEEAELEEIEFQDLKKESLDPVGKNLESEINF